MDLQVPAWRYVLRVVPSILEAFETIYNGSVQRKNQYVRTVPLVVDIHLQKLFRHCQNPQAQDYLILTRLKYHLDRHWRSREVLQIEEPHFSFEASFSQPWFTLKAFFFEWLPADKRTKCRGFKPIFKISKCSSVRVVHQISNIFNFYTQHIQSQKVTSAHTA